MGVELGGWLRRRHSKAIQNTTDRMPLSDCVLQQQYKWYLVVIILVSYRSQGSKSAQQHHLCLSNALCPLQYNMHLQCGTFILSKEIAEALFASISFAHSALERIYLAIRCNSIGAYTMIRGYLFQRNTTTPQRNLVVERPFGNATVSCVSSHNTVSMILIIQHSFRPNTRKESTPRAKLHPR